MISQNIEGSVPSGPDITGPDINAFVLEHGRLPRLTDPVPPWQYRGWLLYYVQLADQHPSLPGRWDHYLRTVEAGHILDEPIPRIAFIRGSEPQGRKMLEKCLDLIHRRDYSWSAFNQFVDWLAWGLAVSRALPPLEERTHQELYRTFNLEPLLLHPYDYLGELLADRRSGGWNPHAFFPTPHEVVEMMVQMTFGGGGAVDSSNDGHEKVNSGETDVRLKTVMDPCVGTGRMLLHASNYSYCLYGCDIDPLVAMISRCNAALYSPWMAFPFSESILGRPLPPPPPAELPVPEEYRPAAGETLVRCDDHGQGLLFG
jgi:hypothetical protein